MATALVGGALASKAGNGGNAWTRISLVRGLQRLGFDVLFVEQLPGATSEQRSYFEDVCGAFGIEGHLLEGPPPEALLERVAGAELLVNVGGHLTAGPLRGAARVKVFLDDDPGYTQLWHAQGLLAGRLAGHDRYFTFGSNIGMPTCPIPTNGIRWGATRPPVVLDDWPLSHGGDPQRFTTVASWRGPYGRVQQNGRLYGQKAHEFRKFAGLPRRSGRMFEIALEIDPEDSADLELLRGGGWSIVDPRRVAADPESFRAYVQGSGAEFSVAQGIYVETRSGWFSDRSVRYLASGKPVLVQDTGFAEQLTAGKGLLAFRTPKEALAGAEAIQADYGRHARGARALAEELFDSDRVLGDLLGEVL